MSVYCFKNKCFVINLQLEILVLEITISRNAILILYGKDRKIIGSTPKSV